MRNYCPVHQPGAAQLTNYWSDKTATKDQDFDIRFVLPLIVKGRSAGVQIRSYDFE